MKNLILSLAFIFTMTFSSFAKTGSKNNVVVKSNQIEQIGSTKSVNAVNNAGDTVIILILDDGTVVIIITN